MTIDTFNAEYMATLQGRDYVYATARSTSIGFNDASWFVGQYKIDAGVYEDLYDLYRCVLKFDTSSIPSNAVISKVNMKIKIGQDSTTTDFNLEIGKYDWSAYDPISAGNREAAYDGVLATGYDKLWRNTNGISLDTYYTSEDLDAAWVNKTGSTYYSLISDREYAGTAPTKFQSEFLVIYPPQLVVEYTIPVSTITGIASITGISSITF